jgi:multidrug resistance efflux pump
MIVFLFNVYLVVLFALVWFKLVPFNLFWKISPAIVMLLLLVGLFIPMGWGAPSGPLIVGRHSVSIVPDVAGEVIDVPVSANKPLKTGDILFRIDPIPFDAQVKALEAQLRLSARRLSEVSELAAKAAGRQYDVEQRQAEVDQIEAQIESAKWNLDKTIVRAPADGYVTNLALRKGARVASLPLSPVMAFIDTSGSIFAAEIPQIYARYIEAGQPVEITFKFFPGQIFTGKVESVLQALSSGQIQVSGQAVTPTAVVSAPFVVRIALDDHDVASRLPVGTTGDAAIFTEHVKAAHIIRRVMLRLIAITNYINPL